VTESRFAALTPALLQSLLTPQFPDLIVHALTIDGTIHGTATKVKVTIAADGPGPRSMWVKAGWEESSEILRSVGIFSREPRVYAQLLPSLGLEVPGCYGASWDETTLDGLLLLEDLAERHARFHSPLDALTPQAVAAMLSILAKMHAATHQAQWQAQHDWLRPLFHDTRAPGSYLNHVSAPATLAHYLAMPRGAAIPAQAHNPHGISAAMAEAVAFGISDDARCMIHGDAHIGNSYSLPDGQLGLLDWQCVWRGGWAFDIAYFIGSSLSPEDRRSCESQLLQHYLEQRSQYGWPAPALDQAMAAYRAYLPYGLTVWLTNSPTFQAEEFNAAVASRFAHALLDHGMLGD
jgi:hypothetical protein